MAHGAPRVFISYSHDSREHSGRILALAIALRNHGCYVELDQFHADEIIDWPRWCTKQTSRECSDFVLCVCTAEYRRRIECNVLPERGKGAHWEGSLLDDDLYDERGNGRIIPLLFDDEPETSIPRFLRGWTFCRIREFQLSDPGYEHLVRILTRQSRALRIEVGTVPILPPDSPPIVAASTPSSPLIAPTRLPRGAEMLFGREAELVLLDTAWDAVRREKTPRAHICTFVAWGGVGKTALVVDWMARQAAAGWPGFARVFDWSFYSQGTREQESPSAGNFVGAALEFFGGAEGRNLANSPASAWDKGARLAQLVAAGRNLLVLDGLEPLQHPPGPRAGELKDDTLSALLKGLAQRNAGLCVVTTREAIADLVPFRNTTAPEWMLAHLSTPAGVDLLKRLGVRGTQAEIESLVRDVKGHSLTLDLLGRFLARAHDGDIRRRDRVKFERADDEQGGHAFGVIEAYEKWLAGGPFGYRNARDEERGRRFLAVLRLLGLFDRPADPACLAALRRAPAIAGLTESLVGLGEDDWNLTVTALVECGLVSAYRATQLSGPKQQQDIGIDAHPLTRAFFAKRLRERSPDAWRAGHCRIYEHLRDSTERFPRAQEGVYLLYQAVRHGCLAGMLRSAFDDVYWKRICRTKTRTRPACCGPPPLPSGWIVRPAYTTHHQLREMGCHGEELATVSRFFACPWEVVPDLRDDQRLWLLYETGLCLRDSGRFSEAVAVLSRGLDLADQLKDADYQAVISGELGGVHLLLGGIAEAIGYGEHAVDSADRAQDDFQPVRQRSRLAHAMHQAGNMHDAATLFAEAELLEKRRQGPGAELHNVPGFMYRDFLCDEGRYSDAASRATKSLDSRPTQLHRALDQLSLARARLMRRPADVGEIVELTEAAVRGIRFAGRQDVLPQALLIRALLRFEGNAEGACTDLNGAWQIAERGPMRLFMADIYLKRAPLFCATKPYPWEGIPSGKLRGPRDDLAAARALIETCGYGRRIQELENAERAAESW